MNQTELNIISTDELPPLKGGQGRPKSRERVALELAAASQPGVWKGLDLGDTKAASQLVSRIRRTPGHEAALRGTMVFVKRTTAS